jgi:hypothetical protein
MSSLQPHRLCLPYLCDTTAAFNAYSTIAHMLPLFHLPTPPGVLPLPTPQVTPVQRNQAKRLAYGLLYGMGAQALAAELGVAVGEALRLSDDFRRSHATLDGWIQVRSVHILQVFSGLCFQQVLLQDGGCR